LHGRLQHLISLRPRPRPPKRRAAGARGSYSRTAASQLAYLLLAYRTLAYSGSPHFIRAPHRTTAPPHHHQGTKKLQPVLSRHWRSRPPLSFFLHSTSLFGPPPRIEHFLFDNSTQHLSSSIATLHNQLLALRYIFGRGRIRLWSSPSFHSLRFTSRRRFRPQGSPQQLRTNKTFARSTSDALSKTRNNDDPAVTTQTSKHSNSSRCCNPLIQTQT
jgi:hypothetical protein